MPAGVGKVLGGQGGEASGEASGPIGPPARSGVTRSLARMESLRQEPFRLLFPIGIALAICGIFPWLLFAAGATRTWPGLYHAFTMTEGFVVAVAAGFLLTMIPRRTRTHPASVLELAVIALGCVAVAPMVWLGAVRVAEGAYLIVLGVLAQFIARRIRQGAGRAAPSFVLIPLALAEGIVGALCLIVAYTVSAPGLLAVGRKLIEEGLPFSLVLAVAPLLTAAMVEGRAVEREPGKLGRAAIGQLAFGILFAVGLVAGALGWTQRGLALSAAVLVVALWRAGVWRRATVAGLHRRLYQIALTLVPLGYLLAAARPAWWLPFLHISFVGGLSLLILAVSFHVVFLHTGRQSLAFGRPWFVVASGLLVLSAMLVRATAERAADYPLALGIASSLWLAGALVWGLAIGRMVFSAPGAPSGHPQKFAKSSQVN